MEALAPMPRVRMVLIPACLIALALGLAACDGDDGGDGDEDQGQVGETIETSLFTTDPDDCTELATVRFREQTEFERGEAAIESCRETIADASNNPDSVEVSDIEVEDGEATASVAIEGGGLDGQTIGLELVREDDPWKLDRIASFVSFDRERFISAVGDPPDVPELRGIDRACVNRELDALSDEQLQGILLDANVRPLARAFTSCTPGG